MNGLRYLSLVSDNQIFVADYGNDKVTLLDTNLNSLSNKGRKINEDPWRLCYNEEKKQLTCIAGGCNGVNQIVSLIPLIWPE